MKSKMDLIKLFKKDLCKDQREIVIYDDKNVSPLTGKVIRKFSNTSLEYTSEIKAMTYLDNHGVKNIPKIVGHGINNGKYYIDMEYFDGIRIFNLLSYMKIASKNFPQLTSKINLLKCQIMKRCMLNQIKIQNVLFQWSREKKDFKIYPQEKMKQLVSLLQHSMGMTFNKKKLIQEVDYIISEFNQYAVIPFRDSTTKNMVLYFPKLFLKNFIDEESNILKADEKRKRYFIEMLENDEYLNLLEAPIIDFDFSSCEHLTTIFDDPIGFQCHEITWTGFPSQKDLLWIDDKKGIELNSKIIAITFIVRYLRFGGRKIAYHLFHPNAYKIRFRYDNESFYFEKLLDVLEFYWPESKETIPTLCKLIYELKKFSKKIDYCNEDIFEMAFPMCNRKFYIDIYPY